MWKLTLGYRNIIFLPPHLLSAWYIVVPFKAESISLIMHKKVQWELCLNLNWIQ
jgi:hypothetical protein